MGVTPERKERKRQWSAESTAKGGFVSGTKVYDPQEVLIQTSRIQEENRNKEVAIKRQRMEAAAKKAEKAAGVARREERVKSLKARFPRLKKANWEDLKRRLGQYYSGTKDIEWAAAKVATYVRSGKR